MPKKSRKNVGLIGLGIIGSRVANALRQVGFHVYVWNRTPRAAPNFVGSPRQVAELCDIIQIFVSDAHALFDVLESMGDSITPSHVIICNATIGPEATVEAARLVESRGAQFLDAPFTGSKIAAQNRELVYYIGGDEKTLAAAEPVLKASSKAIIRIGKIGDAATVKVATNMLAAVAVQTLAEAYAIVRESGIDVERFAEALKHGAARSGVTDAKLPKILERDYEPHFSLKHMFKDVQLGIHIANSLDIDLPATTATAGVIYGGLTKGWGDFDFSVLARAYQKETEALPAAAPKPGDKPSIPPPEEPAKTEAPMPETPKSEPAKTEVPKTEESKAEATATETPKSEPAKTDDPKAEAPKEPEPPKSEPAKTDDPKAEAPKTEPAKAEEPKAETPASEAPKVEPPQADNAEPAKTEAAIAEPAKVEDAKSEPPKAEAPKSEPPKAESAPAKPAEEKAAPEKTDPPPANGQPAEHTPFVRLRRWFGSGSSQ